jgi:hypothetical protein
MSRPGTGPLRNADSVEVLGRVKASLTAFAADAALTRPPRFSHPQQSERSRFSNQKRLRVDAIPAGSVRVHRMSIGAVAAKS